METYKYLIIDDDDMDRLTTSYYLKSYPFLVHSGSFSSSKDALDYLQSNSVDILFLDIDIPEITGLELQKLIAHKVLCTIFITSYSEYALDGFDQNAFDFLVKPINKERLDSCMDRLKEYLEIRLKANLFQHSFNQNSIMVKEGHNYVTISPYEVVYLEALKDYTRIVLLDKKNTIHGNLGTMLNKEYFKDFIRIHKSYAVQKKYIRSIKTNEITLINDIVLPIGQSYKKSLLSILA